MPRRVPDPPAEPVEPTAEPTAEPPDPPPQSTATDPGAGAGAAAVDLGQLGTAIGRGITAGLRDLGVGGPSSTPKSEPKGEPKKDDRDSAGDRRESRVGFLEWFLGDSPKR